MSADDIDIMCTPTEKGDDPSAADKEEEQFGLIPLLQQMSLSELREIARQRGWRVKGTSKADYVSALASLLCDPTETARAVTGMPENLREALRAAFVADDGSGITATTMAQTMTALRGAAATPLRDRVPAPRKTPDRVPESRSQSRPAQNAGRSTSPADNAGRSTSPADNAGRSTGPPGWGREPPSSEDEQPDSPYDLGLPRPSDWGARWPGVGHFGGERAPGPAIKPVEAAVLLIDLARWGLVLPWRDSLYGQGRHVLPWHVQRLLPPLEGWCQPVAQAPATPARARDARQFVNSLYAVWESIAEEPPALCPPVPPGRDAGRPRSGRLPWPERGVETPDGGAAAPPRTRDGVPAPPTTRDGVPAERLAERRLQSLLQGWPYDPQELQSWAGTRRRVETAAQSLSVPPPPFLVEDAALPILARLTQGDGRSLAAGDGHSLAAGDGEELEFVCRLLCELGLVSIQNDHLLAQREQMARFLRRSVADQHRAAAQAYLSLLDWSELDLLLRRNPRLVLWRKPYFTIPYDQFRSLLVRLRHLLLRFLACAGDEGWCRLTDIDAALRELWPHFPAALQSERESWLSQAWGLAWHRDVREPDTAEAPPQRDAKSRHLLGEAESDHQCRPTQSAGRSSGPPGAWQLLDERVPADWEASQGALLRVMLEGPLYWLGFAELSYGDGPALPGGPLARAGPAARSECVGGKLAAFRLHGLANWIWDRPTGRFDLEGRAAGEALTIDEAAGTIAVQPGSVAPEVHTFLGRMARLEEASPERFLYRLHPRAVLATFESGASLSDLLAEWERVMPQPIPSALQQTLSQWWTRYGQVRLYDGFGLLELRDEVTLRELEAGTSLSQHIVARLSPRMVLVPDEAVDDLLREFAAKDYTPKEVT